MVRASYQHGKKEAVARELRRIFGDDLLEVTIVCSESIEVSGEYFSFIRCLNYEQHVEGLVSSSAISGVVPSFDEPSYLSQSEVDEFASSLKETPLLPGLFLGDVVVVKGGPTYKSYLHGLSGVVIRKTEDTEKDDDDVEYLSAMQRRRVGRPHSGAKNAYEEDVSDGTDRYLVFFKFHMRSFRVIFSVTSVNRVGNIFEHLRFPISDAARIDSLMRDDNINPEVLEALSHVVNRD